MRVNKIIVLAIVSVFFLACSNTKVTYSWKAENKVTKAYRNIMVWGILTEKDSALRTAIEKHLVNDLLSKGYRAFSSMDVYRSKAYKRLSSKEILDEFKNSGVDAVITITLLKKENEEMYIPATVVSTAPPLGQVEKYYSSVYDRIFLPAYYMTTTNYFWESNLFEVAGDKLAYSVRTKSFDPSSTERLAHENGLMIISDMIRKKVIIEPTKEE